MCQKIIGKSILTNNELLVFLLHNNKALNQQLYDIGNMYIDLSKDYHIKGDLAFFQMVIFTNWLTNEKMIKNYNFYNAKVNGELITFNSIEDGVLAHIQHIFGYVNDSVINKHSTTIIDPIFNNIETHNLVAWNQFTYNGEDTVDHLYDQCIDYAYSILTKEQYIALLVNISNNTQKLNTLNNSVEKLSEINEELRFRYENEINRNNELSLIIKDNREFVERINNSLKVIFDEDNTQPSSIEDNKFTLIIAELSERINTLSKEFNEIKKENRELKKNMDNVLESVNNTLSRVNLLLKHTEDLDSEE